MEKALNVNEILDKFGAEVVQRAISNLRVNRIINGKKARRYATGNLANSLTFGRFKKGPHPILYFTTKTAKTQLYADFIERGVNGYERSQGSPYSFKRGGGSKPRKGELAPMAAAIFEWIKIKPIRLRNAKGEFIKNTPEAQKSAAIRIAAAIRRRGIPAVPYFGEALEDTLELYGPEFLKKLQVEVQKRLENDQYKPK